MCVCMYVCICIYIYICICMVFYLNDHLCVQALTHAALKCMYVYICGAHMMYVCIHAGTFGCKVYVHARALHVHVNKLHALVNWNNKKQQPLGNDNRDYVHYFAHIHIHIVSQEHTRMQTTLPAHHACVAQGLTRTSGSMHAKTTTIQASQDRACVATCVR